MSQDTAAAEFAARLRELKERSGLSYGVLAKRLHMSTSTLHRYCNGDAVPVEYAPVERLARLCRASPGELVELHRRWVLADAARGRKGAPSEGAAPAGDTASVGEGTSAGAPAPAGEPAKDAAVARDQDAAVRDQDAAVRDQDAAVRDQDAATRDQDAATRDQDADGRPVAGRPAPGQPAAEGPAGTREAEIPAVTGPGEVRTRPRRIRTRTAVLAGIAVAAVLGGVTLALGLPDGGDGGGGDRKDTAGTATLDAGADGNKDVTASPSVSVSASASPSTSASASPSAKAEETPRTPATASAAPADGGDGGAAPLTVQANPYAWQAPCAHRYLINRPASEVEPPPQEPGAAAWASAFGAVSSGEQYVQLTVQGTGDETVVVQGLTVRVAGKRSPLPWNDFVMGYPGVGCGGNVPTRSFTVALDAARPVVTPASGQRNFPFSVSESDPEVYYVTAGTAAYDVSWYLELRWSSGSRSGTLTVDDKGRPFRTSGNDGRPAYEFPLGGEEWVPEGTTTSDQGVSDE
ncbi:helix-turn-helix domain-containing protein [Streptomyces sp. NPDC000348]|uniref:helix-turn-helix domain-containing protein n=1 Tax=Streptomyces sp. NPDC000348 TaxID=3364538 RepID=UPI003681AE3C